MKKILKVGDDIIKDTRNIFKLKKEKEKWDAVIKNIRNLFILKKENQTIRDE